MMIAEAAMKCIFCKTGETHPGTTTVTFDRDGGLFVARHVPAEVCDNCGEGYVDEDTAARVLEEAKSASREGDQIVIREFAPIAA